MSDQPPLYSFLGNSETVIHALDTKEASFVVTDRRFVILKKGGIQEDFDFKYIAHIHSEKKGKRLISEAIICLCVGLFLIFFGYEFTLNPLMRSFGFVIILISIGLLFAKVYTNKLIINLSGVSEAFEYEIKADSEYVQRLVSKIASARLTLSGDF